MISVKIYTSPNPVDMDILCPSIGTLVGISLNETLYFIAPSIGLDADA